MRKNYFRLAGLCAFLSGLAFTATAQLSGVVTINSGQATGGTNYQTFSALASDLNSLGVIGPLTVNVVANTGPYVEQVTLNQITGASSNNKITINGNNNLLTYAGVSGSPFTLLLNGTDYLTINNLQMQGTGTSYAMVCILMNSADRNTFSACSFSCPANGTNSYQVPFSISSSSTSPSSQGVANWNTVKSCTLSSGYYSIYHYGLSSAPFTHDNSFIDCHITDWYYYCVYGYYAKNLTFRNCEFDRMTRTTFTSTNYFWYGWYMQGTMIEQCTFHDFWNSNQSYSGTLYGFYYFGYSNPVPSNRNTFRNNIVRDMKWNGTTYMFYWNYNATNDYYHNTFSFDNAAATGGNVYVFYYCYGLGSNINTWTNNNFSITQGGTGTKYAMYFGGNTIGSIDKNNYWLNSANSFVGYWSSQATTFAQWQAQNVDANGTNIDPMYANVAAGNLHPTNLSLDNLGTPLGAVFDNEGAVRNQTTPDIGALEFNSPSCSGLPPSNSVNSPTYLVCPGEDVGLALGNLSNTTGYSYQWNVSTVSNVGPFTPVAGATGIFYTAPAVTANTWYQIVQTCTNPGGSSNSYVGSIMIAGPSTSAVPYYEDFESIGLPNRLPNCSWSATGLGNQNQTYTTAQSGNRVPRSGTSFATFDNGSTGTSSYYTNAITMNTGITYSAALYYATEYFGYSNWTNLSILIGPNQSATNQTVVAVTSPAISGPYKLLDGMFTVPTSGTYYMCIRATSSSGSAQYLSIDDISITIPCEEGGPNTPVVNANASSTLVCANDPVNLTAAGAASFMWMPGSQTGAAIVVNPTQNITYTVTGTDATSGCNAMATVMIQVNPIPAVFAVANPPVVCAGQTANLSAVSPGNSFAWSTGQNGQNINVAPTTATSYTVIATNNLGCSASFVQNVGVIPNPTISVISSNPAEACKDDQLTLTANGAVTYIWTSNTNPTVYQGNPVNIQASSSTVFTITGTAANGCVSKTTLSQNISDCLGLNNLDKKQFNVYPNPTSGVFNLEFGSNTERQIVVTDLSGRTVLSLSGDNSLVSVDLNAFSNGVYFVKVSSQEQTDVIKVIKQ